MPLLTLARTCELHVHPGGCLTAEDLLYLGKACYRDIDWRLFVDAYESAYGTRPDPVALYRDALSDPSTGFARFKEHFVYGEKDAGDFGRFQAKFNLIICLMRHMRNTGIGLETYFKQVVERHRREGITYIEYRCGCGTDTPEGFIDFHRAHAQVLKEASQNGFTARYIISLRRWEPEEDYDRVQRLLNAYPDLIPTIVGIDFAHVEEGYPPKTLRPLFNHLARDNQKHPDRALGVTYHVGESYFDKSLESAIRWCCEIADMGVRRLGHAIALGLPPEIAIARRPDAHVWELVSERLDQIAYDLAHAEGLARYGVAIDPRDLESERKILAGKAPDERIARPYDDARLNAISNRQRFVLDRLAALGAVIETCPTSNLRIGGVPDPAHHPIHAFLDSQVNLAICADDPGIFDITLADEIDWVLAHTHWDVQTLSKRLSDPRRFQLGLTRKK